MGKIKAAVGNTIDFVATATVTAYIITSGVSLIFFGCTILKHEYDNGFCKF